MTATLRTILTMLACSVILRMLPAQALPLVEGRTAATSGMVYHDAREATDHSPKRFRYIIEPPGAACITLDFNLVSSPLQEDFLRVAEWQGGEERNAQSLGGRSGSKFIQLSGPAIVVEFTRDAVGLGSVWTALWRTPGPEGCLDGRSPQPWQDICTTVFHDNFRRYGNAPPQARLEAGCSPHAHNTALYRFAIAQTGELHFTIKPDNGFDDIDWVLWRDAPDSAGKVGPDTVGRRVACNYAGGRISGGGTGMEEDGVHWDPARPHSPVSAPVPVRKGEVYYLLVDDFTGHATGLSIQFNDIIAACPEDTSTVIDLGQDAPQAPRPSLPTAFHSTSRTLRIDLHAKPNLALGRCLIPANALAPLQQRGKQFPAFPPGQTPRGISAALLLALRAGCLNAYKTGHNQLLPLHFGDIAAYAAHSARRVEVPWVDDFSDLQPLLNHIELLVEERTDRTTGRQTRHIHYIRLLWADAEAGTPDYNMALFSYPEAKPLLEAIQVPHPRNDAARLSLADILEQGLYDAVTVQRPGHTTRNLQQASIIDDHHLQLRDFTWGK